MKIFRKEILLPAAVLFILTMIPAGSAAQESGDTDPELPVTQQHVAPVKVDGKVLFRVRGISSFTAEQRATAISQRIMEAAADPAISVDSLKTITQTDHFMIYAGSKFIMNVYNEDANVEGVSKEILAKIVGQKTTEAITFYRHDRSRPVLLKKSLYALGSLVPFSLILFLILWIFRKINTRIQNRIKEKIDTLEIKSFSLIRAKQLWKAYYLAFKILKIIIMVCLIAFFINYILGLFPWTSNLATNTLKLLIDPILSLGKSFLHFLPDLVFLVVIYLATRYFLKLGKLLFTGLQGGEIAIKNFDPDWAMPTFRIVRIFIVVFAVIIAYPHIPGSESSAFKGISVFIGLLLSLGSSSFISNLIAGYSITYRRAFKKGDLIQVGDQIGFVEEQEVLVTRLLSIRNEEFIIPNSLILNSTIINFNTKSKEPGLIIHTQVGIGYETPWRQVDAMLKEAAERTEGLLKEPQPFVLKRSLGDFAIIYEINAYFNDVSRMHICYSALHQHILDVFNENNVQIMTPAYERDPEIPKVVPKDQWNPPLANKMD
jgi:small-conductance mechanosensitive channel